MRAHGISFGEWFDHNGQQFDALIENVVHMDLLRLGLIGGEIREVFVPIVHKTGKIVGVPQRWAQSPSAEFMVFQIGFGRYYEKLQPREKDVMGTNISHVKKGGA